MSRAFSCHTDCVGTLVSGVWACPGCTSTLRPRQPRSVGAFALAQAGAARPCTCFAASNQSSPSWRRDRDCRPRRPRSCSCAIVPSSSRSTLFPVHRGDDILYLLLLLSRHFAEHPLNVLRDLRIHCCVVSVRAVYPVVLSLHILRWMQCLGVHSCRRRCHRNGPCVLCCRLGSEAVHERLRCL